MLVLQYEGGWWRIPQRNPEELTELAPEPLQRICRIYGGAHGAGRPDFRLVLCSSRYQLAGGHAVTVLDTNGNYVKQIQAEVFLPRYHVPKAYHGLYVLEMWRSPEELLREGYGFNTVEFDDAGNGVRCLEPVWADGCYEAVWNGPQKPFVFPRNSPTDLIQWGIRIAKMAVQLQRELDDMDYLQKQRMLRNLKEADALRAEKLKNEDAYEISQSFRANGGEPMVSLAGVEI